MHGHTTPVQGSAPQKHLARAEGCSHRVISRAVGLPDHGLAGHAVPGAQIEDGAQAHGVQPPVHTCHMQSRQGAKSTTTPVHVAQLSRTTGFTLCSHQLSPQAVASNAAQLHIFPGNFKSQLILCIFRQLKTADQHKVPAPDEGKAVDGAVLVDGDGVDKGGEGEAVAQGEADHAGAGQQRLCCDLHLRHLWWHRDVTSAQRTSH